MFWEDTRPIPFAFSETIAQPKGTQFSSQNAVLAPSNHARPSTNLAGPLKSNENTMDRRTDAQTTSQKSQQKALPLSQPASWRASNVASSLQKHSSGVEAQVPLIVAKGQVQIPVRM